MPNSTPGPWGIEQTNDMLWVGPMRHDWKKVDDVVVALNLDHELTATAKLRQHSNARLIASAPDLLEALHGLNGILGTAESNASGTPEWEHVSAKVNAARKAIAKATGAAS